MNAACLDQWVITATSDPGRITSSPLRAAHEFGLPFKSAFNAFSNASASLLLQTG
jgi:hypothetical protein